jgi:hypothetical protein
MTCNARELAALAACYTGMSADGLESAKVFLLAAWRENAAADSQYLTDSEGNYITDDQGNRIIITL